MKSIKFLFQKLEQQKNGFKNKGKFVCFCFVGFIRLYNLAEVREPVEANVPMEPPRSSSGYQSELYRDDRSVNENEARVENMLFGSALISK